ncbi:VOC family protein [Kribbella shirazensis]|uniref:Catechol 2,3-dioxygenase-like lactoylglutathione lyase family enzyme n=1 Tax=Kribbella shirazensis TaxID=1105143 RepID=A0A7X5VCQ3_9ACTN|nr:VOC family protein [Kribbella shirazensis]NIK57968.1 catechol 2,3-dioxygenase-like lactoylglutathione lyase family enzyme [Kribbella shirazensis]
MAVEFNHTIVNCTDKWASARFLSGILGLGEPGSYGPFAVVELGNGASLDFAEHGQPRAQHYAFLVTEDEFDEIHARIVERGLTYWADPFHQREREINTNDGGRGLYWDDPDGHNLEILTVPYGGWPSAQ